jgi:hypothetical protein
VSPKPAWALSRTRSVLSAAILLGVAVLLAAGCGPKGAKDVLVRVGARDITRADLEAAAGVPADSLTTEDRVRFLETIIERKLVEQEGERRGLAHDRVIEARIAAVRSELYLSKLLAEVPSAQPSDSAIQTYYSAHQQEFLRPVDSYLLELYSSEDQAQLTRFRGRLLMGDTTMLAGGEVTSEGRWLTESGELDRDLERELSSLTPGEVTFPRPYEDGFRVARLVDVYPAGTVLDLSAVSDEIAARLLLEQSRHRQDALLQGLRQRYPVHVLTKDSL